ncbi:HNH endonuclease [[Kitasatospora] papulosa]|uniref:HNH endonuclease n=1 Tax=[Kitasatospora] papulosa TaxID=1464011 RepID=UPI0036A0A25F
MAIECAFNRCFRKDIRARGLCKAHYQQWYTGKTLTPILRDLNALVEHGSKYCSNCWTIKKLSEFHKSVNHEGGRLSQCKPCRLSKQIARYESSEKAALARQRKNRMESLDAERLRECTACIIVKPHDAFYRHPKQRSGLSTICSACRSEYSKKWMKSNPGKSADYRNRWEQKPGSRDIILANRKRFHTRNPDYNRLKASQRRAAEKGSTAHPVSQRQVRSLLQDLGAKCFYCEGPFEHLDHFIPIAKGGAHVIHNLVPACADCNLRKSDKMPWDWMPELGIPKLDLRAVCTALY